MLDNKAQLTQSITLAQTNMVSKTVLEQEGRFYHKEPSQITINQSIQALQISNPQTSKRFQSVQIPEVETK